MGNRKLMKFSKNSIVLPLERTNGWQQRRLGTDWWESSSTEKALGAMADIKWHMSLMCPGGMAS